MLGRNSKTNLRRPPTAVDGSFRRNNAALSSSQREQRARQQAQSQRQLSLQNRIEKHRRRFRLYLFVVLGVVLLLGFRLMIGEVNVASNTTIPDAKKASYEAFIQKTMLENAVLRQIWLVDNQALAGEVRKEFGEIREISVGQTALLRSDLTATLEFREPVCVWRDASKETRFLDAEGVLFDVNYTEINSKELPVIEDESGLVFDAGATVISKNTKEFIGSLPEAMNSGLLEGIKQAGSFKKISIPNTIRELHVYPKNASYYIKFDTSRGVGGQVEELRTLLSYLKKKNIAPKQYVDVRLEGKAFYK